MLRPVTALLAVSLVVATCAPAACATARAAVPFEDIPLERSAPPSHRLAYASMIAGVAGIGGSFALRDRANRRYDDYLAATDPAVVTRLYDETARLDRWSTAALMGGEGFVMAGLYLRFLRHPARFQLAATPMRCAVSLRF